MWFPRREVRMSGPPAKRPSAEGLEYLNRFTLRVRRGMGDRPGDRRFPGRPQPAGSELEAYSAYAPGDDLRHLDWNAVGRLDALLVRRFTAEREVTVHLVLDCSASMGVPAPDQKLAVAAELALALGYVALSANDAVRVLLLGGDGPSRLSRVYRQRASVMRLAELLGEATAAGQLGFGAALEAYARCQPRPGVALVISDLMMEPAEIERGVHALRARRNEVVLLHVIGRGELDPGRDFTRGLLQDVESGATRPIVLTAAARARYREVLDDHLHALAGVAARMQATYARLTTDTSVREFLTVELPRLGVIGRR
jgi:uncharacterized protein (DUF58 family)